MRQPGPVRLLAAARIGALACLAFGIAPPTHGAERLALRLEPLETLRPREVRFVLDREVELRLHGQATGSRHKMSAYGWIIDATSRKVVWSMTNAEPEEGPTAGHDLVFDHSVRLAPGSYSAGIVSLGYGVKGHLKGLKGLLQGLPPDAGKRGHLEIWLDAEELDALRPATEDPTPGQAEIRLAPLGDDALIRRRFRLSQPAEVRILAMGERGPMSSELADQSWLLDLESRRVVWSLASEPETRKAGGSGKNEIADRVLALPAGNYELVAMTDDSHSAAEWNAAPPWNPSDWGVTLWAPPEAIATDGVPAERLIVRLSAPGDDDSLAATFRLDTEAVVRLAGIGEWSQAQGSLVDRGWIEPAGGGAPVWSMGFEGSTPGGGSAKNRAVDHSIRLSAGIWRVRYVTDDSHSKAGWNAAPPAESRLWGLSVSTFDPAARFELVEFATAGASSARR